MDIAYLQHSPAGRKARSPTNLNHLTLAPLTTRIPIRDLPDHEHTYIENRSAPTTPSILSRSSSRVGPRKQPPTHLSLPKSKSSTHLAQKTQPRSGTRSGTTTPGGLRTPGGTKLKKELQLTGRDRNDSDWLSRAGAAITSSTRESKGQAWLVSRASSTSLTAQRDEEEEELEQELSRRESRRGSVIGSVDADDEFSPVTTRRSLSFGPGTASGSRPISRLPSRGNSRRGSKAQLFPPDADETEGYFNQRDFVTEPDFVDIEEEDYEDPDEAEATVRKLASTNSAGLGGWVEKMLGWSLFAVDEDGEDDAETEVLDEKEEDSEVSSRTSRRQFDSITGVPAGGVMPPLQGDDAGGWQDAAWLLSVATKVLL